MAASATPIGFCTSMWMMKKMTLFFSAFQKSAAQRSSPNSTMKLPRPTKAGWPSTVLNSDRRSVSMSGRIMTAE
jgi:hypothetical protein